MPSAQFRAVQIIEMGHFVDHSDRRSEDGPVDVLGTNIDFPVCLVFMVPDFIYTAPAIGCVPAVRRYRDGWTGQFPIV